MIRCYQLSAALLAVVIAAQPALAQEGPAELPPADFAGNQYIDSAGCAFIRATVGGETTWTPRLNAQRQPLCGFEPTGTDVAEAEPAGTGEAVGDAVTEMAGAEGVTEETAPAVEGGSEMAEAAPEAVEGEAEMAEAEPGTAPEAVEDGAEMAEADAMPAEEMATEEMPAEEIAGTDGEAAPDQMVADTGTEMIAETDAGAMPAVTPEILGEPLAETLTETPTEPMAEPMDMAQVAPVMTAPAPRRTLPAPARTVPVAHPSRPQPVMLPPGTLTQSQVCAGRTGVLSGYVVQATGLPVDCGGGPSTASPTEGRRITLSALCAEMAETGARYIYRASGAPVVCGGDAPAPVRIAAGQPYVAGTPSYAAPSHAPVASGQPLPTAAGVPARVASRGCLDVMSEYLTGGGDGNPACGIRARSGELQARLAEERARAAAASAPGTLSRNTWPVSNPVGAATPATPVAGYEAVWTDGRINPARGLQPRMLSPFADPSAGAAIGLRPASGY